MLSKRSIDNITRRQEKIIEKLEAGEELNPLVVSAEFRLAVELLKAQYLDEPKDRPKLPDTQPLEAVKIQIKEEKRECRSCYGTKRVRYNWGFGVCPDCNGQGHLTVKVAHIPDEIIFIESEK